MEKICVIRTKMVQHPDLICFIEDDPTDSTKVILRHPHAIIMNNDKQQNSNPGLVLVPYIPGYVVDDNTITISKSDIFTVFQPIDEMKNRFSAQYGSGLVLPGNNSIKIPTATIGSQLS